MSFRKIRMPVHGVFLLDKVAGYSSNNALIKVKHLLNAQKAGHTGTLDPFATGLLPLCFGEATKFSQDLLDADKTYEAIVYLGVITTTGDLEGDVVKESNVVNVTNDRIESILARFRGRLHQVPPMYSALKRNGKPLYEYARAGVTFEREARSVMIHELMLLHYCSPYIKLRIKCSKGTYIRVLGEDIGTALGCGAHLQALRRIQVGNLSVDQAWTLNQLNDMLDLERVKLLRPIDELLVSFPKVMLTSELTRRFLNGQRLALNKQEVIVPSNNGRVRVYCLVNGQLLGTAKITDFNVLMPERLIAIGRTIIEPPQVL